MISKYINSKIYKICGVSDKIYIGSTIKPLNLRFSQHKNAYKDFLKNGKNYISSIEIFKESNIDNCKIELLLQYPCENKSELLKKEGEYIKLFKNVCVNFNIAGRSQQEWILDNPLLLKEIRKRSYLKWGKIRNIRTRVFCSCGGHYPKRNMKIHLNSQKHQKYLSLLTI